MIPVPKTSPKVSGGQLSRTLIQETAQEGAHHASGEGQRTSGSHEIADEGGAEGHGHPVSGA